MNKFIFTVEPEAFEGVKRIAKKVAQDFERVCGVYPDISESHSAKNNINFIFATLEKSPLIEKFKNEGKFDPSGISGKREVYQIKLIDGSFGSESKTILICGSDKRGTIYGMFALSEYIGVSPLHFWGDVQPSKRANIEINKDIEKISKEPSVKYRGFFINDEWPCFGKWTFGRYNGFNAEMYDNVFELLLRLKGNYLWPAMWTSSFSLDGPGNLNEELADIYGVVMGASHHEPCLRASEEWDLVRGKDSIYGNEWNYYTNKNGLIKYWEDALKRSGKYEKIITIGMRGERDSSMLGANATLKDNIDLLKDIIKNQRELIKKHVNSDIEKVPQLLALYKEVEEYFYGSDQVEGLKYWDELDGVICMFCEDNFGFMRTLPTKEIRNRKGGFGMYYHFDYHGGPVSYEWMPSITYERTWEQMSMAYDYGIKDVWIVNVGDLKFNEVPLTYFLELAYDFEKWGTNAPNKIDYFTSMWLEKTFPNIDKALRENIAGVLHGYIKLNSMRRPEAQNADIYHPCHYLEADRLLDAAAEIEKTNENVYSALSQRTENEKDAYYSTIYFPAKISINLLRMNLYAAKNKHFANQGKKIANKYADLVTECIEKDRALCEEFGRFNGGKWKGMELEQHIGFTRWNDDNYRYPLRMHVEPVHKPRMLVSRKDRERVYAKTYGNPETIKIEDFLFAGNDTVIIEIANDGIGSINYFIEPKDQYDWLEVSSLKGSVEYQEEIIIRCNRKKLDEEIKNTHAALADHIAFTARLLIKDGETTVAVDIKAKSVNTDNLTKMTFLENDGVIAIEANHFCEKKDVTNGSFTELKNYCRSGILSKEASGMKVYPTTSDFAENDDKPTLTYRYSLEEAGEYTAEIWTTPTNSVIKKRPLRIMLSNSKEKQVITTIDEDFNAGSNSDWKWGQGVLENIRITKASIKQEKGVNEISIGALEAGLVLERILIYKEDTQPLKSYLGMPESFYVK